MPAYNVEKEIYTVLSEMERYRPNIIIIDDGSVDNTFQVCKSLNFNVIKLEKNTGIANALRVGIDYAMKEGYKKAIFMDSDGQHSPRYIDDFVEMLDEVDFVIGNRFHINTTTPEVKLGSNLLASNVVKEISGKKYNDISCGFKAIKLSEELRAELDKSNGYSFVFDLFFYALKHNYEIGSVDMESLYNYGEFLFTRKVELLAFISSLATHVENDILECLRVYDLKDKILKQKDFVYSINNMEFYGFYLKEKDGYIIQSDPAKLKIYLNS